MIHLPTTTAPAARANGRRPLGWALTATIAVPLFLSAHLACAQPEEATGAAEGAAQGTSQAGTAGGETSGTVAPRGDDAGKRALVVTIGEYDLWNSLASDNDYPLIREALLRHGFPGDSIRHVHRRGETSRSGLQKRLDALVEETRPGDVVVFHYSGHGQRITDDDHDEVDGYDEALVPRDAPRTLSEGYDGRLHLRDDDLSAWLQRLRRAAGPGGEVFVSIDSCHSGGAARARVNARGGAPPLGPPQPPSGAGGGAGEAPTARDEGNLPGFVDEAQAAASRGATAGSEGGLAPLVVFGAARHDEPALETYDSAGNPVGSLSWALARALGTPGPAPSYRQLGDTVRRLMAKDRVPNQPQAQGALDRRVFGGGAVEARAAHPVTAVDSAGERVQIGAGSASGVLEGAVLELHRSVAAAPSPETLLAAGRVTRASPFTARVKLEEAAPRDALSSALAYLTRPSYGTLRIGVRVEGGGDWRRAVDEALAREAAGDTPLVRLDGEPPDLVISPAEEAGHLEILAARQGSRVGPLLATASPDRLATKVVRAVRSYALYSYLKALTAESPGMEVEAVIHPCRLACDAFEPCAPGPCTCTEDLPLDDFRDAGGSLSFPVGAGYRLELVNRGQRPAYVSVFDFMPTGEAAVLWPPRLQSAAETGIAPGTSFTVPAPFQVCPPLGYDLLKVVATNQPTDFRPILAGTQRGPEDYKSDLDRLFASSLSGRRGTTPTYGPGQIATYDQVVRITATAEATEPDSDPDPEPEP